MAKKKKSAKKRIRKGVDYRENKKSDGLRSAKPIGYRFKGDSKKRPSVAEIQAHNDGKKNGVYYENRPERSDARPHAKRGERFKKGGRINRKQTAKGIEKDSHIKAKKSGKRISADGNVYYEGRKNRSDLNRTKKLVKGGRVNRKLKQTKAGVIQDKKIKALSAGKRISRKGGKNQFGKTKGNNIYHESRVNRSDANRTKKFCNGGDMDARVNRKQNQTFATGGNIQSMTTVELAKKMGMSMKDINKENLSREDLVALVESGLYKKGGKVDKNWIAKALSGHKGALRKTAMQKGLLKDKDDKLSKTDLHKLEGMGGKTAKRAHLAETLKKFEGGGAVDEVKVKLNKDGDKIKYKGSYKDIEFEGEGEFDIKDENGTFKKIESEFEAKGKKIDKESMAKIRAKLLEELNAIGINFEEGGKVKKEFVKEVKDVHSKIDEVVLKDGTHVDGKDLMVKGGGVDDEKEIKKRLEHLRKELRAERISYEEIAELQSLKKHIKPNDVELLEAAGVKEKHAKGGGVDSELSASDIESKLGRKLCWSDYPTVSVGGKTYRKVFMHGIYKLEN